MEPSKTVRTAVINARAFALFIAVFILVGIACTFLLMWELKMPYLSFVGLAIAFSAPMVFIHAYNDQQDELSRIAYLPPLFASKWGTYAILGLTLLLAGAILAELMYKPKAIPYTLMPGLLLYFVILLQRKRDMDRYEKMK